MGCAAVATGSVCLAVQSRLRSLRWAPLAMTVGGLWAVVPDMPRVFQEDFPNSPLASILGSDQLEDFLNAWGNVFFFHRMLDLQPETFALLGLILILLFYNVSITLLMWLERRSLAVMPTYDLRHHDSRSNDLIRRGSGERREE